MDWTDLNDLKELQLKVLTNYPQFLSFLAKVQFNQFSHCWFTGLLLYFKLCFFNVFDDIQTLSHVNLRKWWTINTCSQCQQILWILTFFLSRIGPADHIWRCLDLERTGLQHKRGPNASWALLLLTIPNANLSNELGYSESFEQTYMLLFSKEMSIHKNKQCFKQPPSPIMWLCFQLKNASEILRHFQNCGSHPQFWNCHPIKRGTSDHIPWKISPW
jgi:hypothetical protein